MSTTKHRQMRKKISFPSSHRALASAGNGVTQNRVKNFLYPPNHRANPLTKTMLKEGAVRGTHTCKGDVFIILIDDFLFGDIQGALGDHVIGLLHTG